MSITLLANAINLLQVGGVTIENDTAAAVTNLSVDFDAQMLTFSIMKGVVNGANFTPGAVTQGNLVIHFNYVSGAWTVDGSTLTGTVSGVALTNLQTTIKGWRNALETFSNNNSIQPGTVVAW